jgi:hypothetical protein
MRVLKTSSAILFISLLLDGCAHALTVAPGYTVSEIPYAAHILQWIDNETVLFAGARRTGGTLNRHSTWGSQGVHRWNVRNGEVVELMKVGEGAAMLCYDRGHLYVAFNRGDERVIREGSLGQEKEIVYKWRSESPFKGVFNPYNCRYREIPRPTGPDYGVVTVLRDDHGFIEAERPSEPLPDRKYYLVRPSGERIQITLPCLARAPRFSVHRQAYVYQDGGGAWGPDVERRICVIGVDGRVIEHKLPKGPWMDATVYGMPTRQGTLMVSLASLAKAEGAYLVKGEKVEQLLKGYIAAAFAVSPDGCKVAVSINPDTDNRGLTRSAVVNVCERSN